MKTLVTICMLLAASFAWAVDAPAATAGSATVVKGQVLEIKDVDNYTYLRLKTEAGESWAAVSKAAVKKGDKVTIDNVMVMNNFESKTLKKTFPVILFGTLAGSGSSASAGNQFAAAHPGGTALADNGDIHVDKASGANAKTVAEVMTGGAVLKERTVAVRGKVVKYSPDIMGKNWVHLRDGSGSAENRSNDILVTTKDQVKIGDVVTATGVVRTDQDFGAGYAYKVLIEEAKLQ